MGAKHRIASFTIETLQPRGLRLLLRISFLVHARKYTAGFGMIPTTLQQWSTYLEELHSRIAHRFLRPEVRERAYRYLSGLLGEVRRKNSWQMAEAIGEARSRGVQHLLNDACWDPDLVREDLRRSTS